MIKDVDISNSFSNLAICLERQIRLKLEKR